MSSGLIFYCSAHHCGTVTAGPAGSGNTKPKATWMQENPVPHMDQGHKYHLSENRGLLFWGNEGEFDNLIYILGGSQASG